LELQLERGGEIAEFAALTEEITNSVKRSHKNAKELLDEPVAKLIPVANIVTAEKSNPLVREPRSCTHLSCPFNADSLG
jgi:hypothetical protein